MERMMVEQRQLIMEQQRMINEQEELIHQQNGVIGDLNNETYEDDERQEFTFYTFHDESILHILPDQQLFLHQARYLLDRLIRLMASSDKYTTALIPV